MAIEDHPLFKGLIAPLDKEEDKSKELDSEDLLKNINKEGIVLGSDSTPVSPETAPKPEIEIHGFDYEATEELIKDPEQLAQFRAWRSRMQSYKEEAAALRALALEQQKICDFCGATYPSKRSWGKYCGIECRQAAYWRRRLEKAKR